MIKKKKIKNLRKREKMNKKLIILLSILTTFVACTNSKIKEYTGTYTYGHELEIFTDDKTGQDYWIYDGESDKLNEYMSGLIQGENSYPEVKIKIRGIDKGKATNGLAEDGDRILKVLKYEILE